MHSDTTIEAARRRIQVLKDLDGEERLRQALDLSETVKRLAELGRLHRNGTEGSTAPTGAA